MHDAGISEVLNPLRKNSKVNLPGGVKQAELVCNELLVFAIHEHALCLFAFII